MPHDKKEPEKNMKKNLIYLLLLLLCSCSTADVLAQQPEEKDENNQEESTETPQLPGEAVGFATTNGTITGGKGGATLTVTTAAELERALKRSEKLIIYISGTVKVETMVSVKATNKTILGLPGSVLTNPNRTQTGSGILYFKPGSSNLILRNLTFKSAGAYDTDGRDNLCIDGTTNIWVDHCDFQDGVDGNFDCKNASDNIAVTWCRFRYFIAPLAGGPGGNNDHRFANLWGNSDSHTEDRGHLRTTFQYCWWGEGCVDRMPRVRFGQIHIANCLFDSSTASGCIGLGKEADILVEKSVFRGIKKPYKTYNVDGKITLTDCLYPNSKTLPDIGQPFTPPYALATTAVDKVEELIKEGCGAILEIKN